MGIEYYENDNVLNGHPLDTRMMRIKCPSCVGKGRHKIMSWDIPVKNGYGNPWDHYCRCIGNADLINATIEAGKQEAAAKLRGGGDDDDDDDESSKPKSQQTIKNPAFGIYADDKVKSIHQWLELIVEKNMPLGDVECKTMQGNVKYTAVKSTKTVMDTAHRLVRIVEDKIAKMTMA